MENNLRYLKICFALIPLATTSAYAAATAKLDLAGDTTQKISIAKDQMLQIELHNAMLQETYEVRWNNTATGHEESQPLTVSTTHCAPRLRATLLIALNEKHFRDLLTAAKPEAARQGKQCETEINALTKRSLAAAISCPNFMCPKKIFVARQGSPVAWVFDLSTPSNDLDIDARGKAQDFEITPHETYKLTFSNTLKRIDIAPRWKDHSGDCSAPGNQRELKIECRNAKSAVVRLPPGRSLRIVASGSNIDRGVFKHKRVFRFSSGRGNVSAEDVRNLDVGLAILEDKLVSDGEKEWLKGLRTGFDAYKKEFDGNRAFKGSVSLGFTGDETGEDVNRAAATTKYKLDLGFDLRRGQYPHQFAVKSRFSVTSSNEDRLDDEVSSVSFKYDYYFTPSVEAFGFLERTSNSFMSIDQRYEAGAGVKFEYNAGWLTRSGHDKQLKILKLEDACNQPNAACDDKIEKLFRKIPDEEMYELIRHQHTSLETGILFGVFAELEDPAELEVTLRNASDPANIVETPLKRTPESRRGGRFEIRPSFAWRPINQIAVEGGIYYKWALDKPVRPYDNDLDCSPADPMAMDALPPATLEALCSRERDTHRHGFFEVSYEIDESGTTKLVLGLDWYFDRTPPRYILSNSEVDMLTATTGLSACDPGMPAGMPVAGVLGCVPRVISAEKNYRKIGLSIKRDFK